MTYCFVRGCAEKEIRTINILGDNIPVCDQHYDKAVLILRIFNQVVFDEKWKMLNKIRDIKGE